MSKSSLFTAYNTAKSLDLDRGRLNRGLGIAQRKSPCTKYITTESYCSCPDFWYRRTRCKHIIALVLKEVAS